MTSARTAALEERRPRMTALEERRSHLPARASSPVRPALQLTGLLLLLLGGLVGWLVRNGRPTPGVDLSILRSFENDRLGPLVTISKFIEYWDGPKGSPYVMAAVFVLIFLFRHRLLAILALLMALLAWTPGHFSKYLFPRDRPPASVHPVLHVTGPNSFPSGHTGLATAAVVAGAFCLTMLARLHARTVWIVVGLLVVVLVGLSRMLLAVHYPSDVLGGALLAGGTSLVLWPPFAALYAWVDRHTPWWTS